MPSLLRRTIFAYYRVLVPMLSNSRVVTVVLSYFGEFHNATIFYKYIIIFLVYL